MEEDIKLLHAKVDKLLSTFDWMIVSMCRAQSLKSMEPLDDTLMESVDMHHIIGGPITYPSKNS